MWPDQASTCGVRGAGQPTSWVPLVSKGLLARSLPDFARSSRPILRQPHLVPDEELLDDAGLDSFLASPAPPFARSRVTGGQW